MSPTRVPLVARDRHALRHRIASTVTEASIYAVHHRTRTTALDAASIRFYNTTRRCPGSAQPLILRGRRRAWSRCVVEGDYDDGGRDDFRRGKESTLMMDEFVPCVAMASRWESLRLDPACVP